ncbi:MAG: SDR family NAD(P)-dependent oxidoreductase [Alphaproteobacteria bacterium]
MAHYFITGVTSGIGAALVKQLCTGEHHVSGVARRADRLAETSQNHENFHGLTCDVTDSASLADNINAAVTNQGPVDVAILNAGMYQPQDGSRIDPAIYAQHMDVNYMGVVNALAALVPAMIKNGRGHIVIIASVAGWRGLPRSAAYGPTKAALISLAESLYFDLHPKGIRIQVICPGFVESEATAINDFEMPGLMSADKAAQDIIASMETDVFMPHFPKPFTRGMSWLRYLPHKWFFQIVGKRTGYL